jgi:Zn-finger nucleic acid-binding protein
VKCPRCKQNVLTERSFRDSGVKLDVCPKCKGVWFDRRELERVLDVADRHLDVPADAMEGTRPCPRCELPLYRFPYPQTRVHIDMCKKCRGLWLDHSEFKEIQRTREALRRAGTLERHTASNAARSGLLRFIAVAIGALKPP